MNECTGKLVVFIFEGCAGPDGKPKEVNATLHESFSLFTVYL